MPAVPSVAMRSRRSVLPHPAGERPRSPLDPLEHLRAPVRVTVGVAPPTCRAAARARQHDPDDEGDHGVCDPYSQKATPRCLRGNDVVLQRFVREAKLASRLDRSPAVDTAGNAESKSPLGRVGVPDVKALRVKVRESTRSSSWCTRWPTARSTVFDKGAFDVAHLFIETDGMRLDVEGVLVELLAYWDSFFVRYLR